MEARAQIIFTFIILTCDFFLLLPQYIYRKNKKEWDRRYWGKNRTWLKNQMTYQVVIAVVLFLFLLGIWFDV